MIKLKVFDEYDKKSISSTFSFVRYIHKFGQKKNIPEEGTDELWFRGQADGSWELKPSIGRNVADGGVYDNAIGGQADHREEALLQRFRSNSYPFVKRLLTDWEAIILGKHYQLPTRLLDWTRNPLAALFFAAETHRNVDAAIFMYRQRKEWTYHISTFEGQNSEEPIVPNPLKVKGVKIVFPVLLADRLIVQSGGFTIQDPSKCLIGRGEEDFDEKNLDLLEVYKWKLPKDCKRTILYELHRVGINRMTLFPGLDGVGYGLRAWEQLRQVQGTWSS